MHNSDCCDTIFTFYKYAKIEHAFLPKDKKYTLVDNVFYIQLCRKLSIAQRDIKVNTEIIDKKRQPGSIRDVPVFAYLLTKNG